MAAAFSADGVEICSGLKKLSNLSRVLVLHWRGHLLDLRFKDGTREGGVELLVLSQMLQALQILVLTGTLDVLLNSCQLFLQLGLQPWLWTCILELQTFTVA